eukprot:Awhi_evm1s1236
MLFKNPLIATIAKVFKVIPGLFGSKSGREKKSSLGFHKFALISSLLVKEQDFSHGMFRIEGNATRVQDILENGVTSVDPHKNINNDRCTAIKRCCRSWERQWSPSPESEHQRATCDSAYEYLK